MALFLPEDASDTSAYFQAWHAFDLSTQRWGVVTDAPRTISPSNTDQRTEHDSRLVLVTWNVDAFAPLPEKRIEALVSHILGLTPAAEIIFLQEVSRAALDFLLHDPRLRASWFLSEADETNWELQSFATMTLLSKARFANVKESSVKAALGPIWRVMYPSRYGRDALCCDVFFPPSRSAFSALDSATRLRLINVHLDSLPTKPSRRPRQLSIVASLLRSAGHGLVAGDFNPVLPEDETLIQDNRLVDAWLELHPDDPGYTWGTDGKEPFPPNRLDRVAVVGLKVQDMEVLPPGNIIYSYDNDEISDDDDDEILPWSDHSGLRCSFGAG